MSNLGHASTHPSHVYSTAKLAALYIRSVHPTVTKVFCVGMSSLREELEAAGIDVVGADQHVFAYDNPVSMEVFESYELDPGVQAVVFGLDTEYTYSKLALAALYVNTGGCKLIATNEDACMNVGGRKYPSNGAILASLLVSLKDPTCCEVIGKPNPYCIE